MASVKIETIQPQPLPPPKAEKVVTITLNEDEACALRAIIGVVSFEPHKALDKVMLATDQLYSALAEFGGFGNGENPYRVDQDTMRLGLR